MSGFFESVRWKTCTQTRPRFILSCQVLGNGVRTHVNFKAEISSTGGTEQERTLDAASGRTASPTHYQLSYSGPSCEIDTDTVKGQLLKGGEATPFPSAHKPNKRTRVRVAQSHS